MFYFLPSFPFHPATDHPVLTQLSNMSVELPPLPWERSALAPHISEETIDYHYGKHHAAYVTKLNGMIKVRSLFLCPLLVVGQTRRAYMHA